MRIAVFTDSFYPELGGIQDSILLTSRALGERGHEVVIFAPEAAERDFRTAGVPVGEVELGANVRVQRLLSLPVPSSTGQSRFLVPTGRRWRELIDFKPDVIHSHTFLAAGWEALRAARMLQVPIVGTNHWAIGEFGTYMPLSAELFSRLSVKAVTQYYNRCAMVTAPSRSVTDEMRQHGLRQPHCVVSNPIDTGLFRPASETQHQALKQQLGFTDATILYAGRLANEKNIDVLIRALPQVLNRVPDAMLALAGHGSARDRLVQLAQSRGVSERVRFMGTLDKAALADAYRAADLFAIASTSETQSMVLLQAMSAGLPAVGARWRALTEYVDEQAGLLATPGDHEDFAEKMTTILRDAPQRQQMSAHATRVSQRYSISHVTDTWEAIYTDICQTSQGAGTHVMGAQQ